MMLIIVGCVMFLAGILTTTVINRVKLMSLEKRLEVARIVNKSLKGRLSVAEDLIMDYNHGNVKDISDVLMNGGI